MVKKVEKWQADDGSFHDSEQAAKAKEELNKHEAMLYDALGSWTSVFAVSRRLWDAGYKIVRRR